MTYRPLTAQKACEMIAAMKVNETIWLSDNVTNETVVGITKYSNMYRVTDISGCFRTFCTKIEPAENMQYRLILSTIPECNDGIIDLYRPTLLQLSTQL